MDDFDILLTGVGGQGVQLVAKTLALAATLEGRPAMMTEEATDSMRGGHSAAAVSIAQEQLRALPVLSSAGFALVLHPLGWDKVVVRLVPRSIVVVSELFDPLATTSDFGFYKVEAGRIAREAEAPLASGLVLLAAFARLTGCVQCQSLVDAMQDLLPSYRRHHASANADAIKAGWNAHPFQLAMDQLTTGGKR